MIRVPKYLIWWDLNKRNIPRGYIEIIKDMYEGAGMSLRATCGETGDFPVTIGLHQGSALRSYDVAQGRGDSQQAKLQAKRLRDRDQ